MTEDAEVTALRAYAAMMNTLDATRLEPFLAEDFVYESQWVFSALKSKQAFLGYIRDKLETIRHANAPVFAELCTVAEYGRDRPCVVLAQGTRENLGAVVLAEMTESLLKRLDLCFIPHPQAAKRSGEYPE